MPEQPARTISALNGGHLALTEAERRDLFQWIRTHEGITEDDVVEVRIWGDRSEIEVWADTPKPVVVSTRTPVPDSLAIPV